MVIGDNTIFAVQKWIGVSIRRMQANLASDGTNNSGTLTQSLGDNFNDVAKVTNDILNVKIEAVDYWEFVDQGRPPGKNPPVTGILRWVQTKLPPTGNDLGTAFAISKTIGKEGVKGTEFMSKVITEARVKDLEAEIADAMEADLIEEINSQIE